MNMLAQIQNDNNTDQVTMSSPELVDYINAHRQEVATIEKPFIELQHRSFMSKVPQVLGVEATAKFIAVDNFKNGTGGTVQRQIYRFPKREACLMAMSYSYELQAQVFDRMTAMEQHIAAQNLPSYAIEDPIERAKKWIEEEKQKQIAIQERDHAIATKAEIGSRREATAMGRLSAKVKEVEKLKTQLDSSTGFATIKKVQALTGGTYDTYELRRYSKTNRLEIQKAEDANYGSVNSYHKDAWLAVYNINLSNLNGAA
ncbi:hypothetical protein [Acinetobacter johnsonii]|uniref:Prophage antirepressor n=1 Tax=Acinetobacter johnsonii TaxID=40214 RepID=A0A380U457_ACIJO|nr:hypothetical protein [Acinetobacter johnsonii]ENU39276.1 hypothetical protein F986_02059 [Acinetobacter johnsonii CIP 64.6]QPS04825.1 hypothetical protein I6G67_05020 [Acinetobacter johnsonii]SUT95498.1 prophage antirepressor [Acinetobacter johnsonii]